MATGQSETLKQFQELAEAVLHVTERQERLTERQERLMERAAACAGTFEQLERRAAGVFHSFREELESSHRRLVEQYARREAQIRHLPLWQMLLIAGFYGGFFGAMGWRAADRLVEILGRALASLWS